MSMYNLLEYSQNCSMISGNLWNYSRDQINDDDDDDDYNASDGKSLKYKTKIIAKTKAKPARPAQPPENPNGSQPPQPVQLPILPLNTEVTIPLKYLSNFWRFLDLPLINCETEHDLKFLKNCVLIEEEDHITGVVFIITSTKLYVPVVTFSII